MEAQLTDERGLGKRSSERVVEDRAGANGVLLTKSANGGGI